MEDRETSFQQQCHILVRSTSHPSLCSILRVLVGHLQLVSPVLRDLTQLLKGTVAEKFLATCFLMGGERGFWAPETSRGRGWGKRHREQVQGGFQEEEKVII
jgi:hypothetical protein